MQDVHIDQAVWTMTTENFANASTIGKKVSNSFKLEVPQKLFSCNEPDPLLVDFHWKSSNLDYISEAAKFGLMNI